MCGLVINEPVSEDIVVEHCGLLGMLVEIKEEVVRVVCEPAVGGIHGKGGQRAAEKEREERDAGTGEWREDGSN